MWITYENEYERLDVETILRKATMRYETSKCNKKAAIMKTTFVRNTYLPKGDRKFNHSLNILLHLWLVFVNLLQL